MVRRRSQGGGVTYRHESETRRASKAFSDALEVGDNLVHVIKPVLYFRFVCTGLD